MVAIRFKTDEGADNGFMLLIEHGTTRTLPGEIYVCQESALKVLEAHQIAFDKVPLPLDLDEAHSLRDIPTTVL
jgi:hypothetical protein